MYELEVIDVMCAEMFSVLIVNLRIHIPAEFMLGLQNFESQKWSRLNDIIMTVVVFGLWFYVFLFI